MSTDQLTLSISKEALSALPAESFDGYITVVDSESQANAALEYLEREKIVGFDTETRPSFRKGVSYKVALVQISTADRCFLFRINRFGITDRLRKFFENEAIVKIGLSLKDDFFMLHKVNDFTPKGFIDLQDYVKEFSIADISLQKIYGIVFDRRISKGQRLTNWEATRLTPAQQHYAALDAWACLNLYNHFRAGKFDPAASPYHVEPAEEP